MFSSSYERNKSLLDAERSALLIIDIQEKFVPVIPDIEHIIEYTKKLILAANKLEVPIIFTEQYPRGLGSTVPDLLEAAGTDKEVFSKMSFSCLDEPEIWGKLKGLGRDQIVIAGVETHVCVLQTVMDLTSNFDGWVSVVTDVVGTRKSIDHEGALRLLEKESVSLVTAEMVVTQWLQKAGTPVFKDIMGLIK